MYADNVNQAGILSGEKYQIIQQLFPIACHYVLSSLFSFTAKFSILY